MDDDAKKIILARRARFIAAALASVGVAQACEGSGPEPGPSFAAGGAETSGGASGAGGAGMAGAIPIPQAGVAGTGGGNGGEGGDGEGGAPQPCLVPPN